ncbi:MAG: penicillin acylase family protein [Pseudomonadota bacterium]
MRPTAIKFSALSLVLALTACGFGSDSSSSAPGAPRTGSYDARIVRTQMGIPHITANDFGSLGYGQAYAFAEDNLCVMMEDFITSRGERARYFGADGSYRIEPNGSVADNVSSDFFWKFMLDDAAWQRTRSKTEPQFRELVTGYVAGFNRYIAELKAGKHPGRHAACAKGEWLQPIVDADMYRRFVRLSILASSSVFVSEIANAQPPAIPPSASAARSTAKSLVRLASLSERKRALARAPGPFADLQQKDHFGSNMYAIGKNGSASGQPIVYGNPHFPWRGTERLYISHNTIPGKIDIMGSSLYGVPAVLIGFNDKVAWSHTVSTAYRFTLYELKVNPVNPTQYLYEGGLRDMTAVPLKVQVKQADGSLQEMTRTLYKSHFGPMITLSASGVPILPWANGLAYTLRDANYENDRLINQFGRWNMAKSLDDFIGLHKSILGVPWVNTVASGPNGRAYYGDVTVVPNVTDAQVSSCSTSPLGLVVAQVAPGLPLLDGSRAACEWGTDADAPAPGIFGSKNLPTLVRDDYVHNCNDSYWLTNPKAPVTGFSRIIGDEGTERSLRTRLCILQAERRLAGTDGRPGTTFTIPALQDIALSSQIYSVELARKQVLDSLCTQPLLIGSAGPVAAGDQAAACAVLTAWDGKDNLASVGSHVWREFFRRAVGNLGGLPVGLPATPLTGIWQNAFSASDPVNTPNTLNTNNLQVQQAFADGIAAVKASGIPFDRPLGQIQYSGVQKNSRIPIFGGEGSVGAFTIVSTQGENLTKDGYGIVFGNSYIQAVTWDAKGQPQAEGFITYSQSTDPASPHYDDFTKAYSQKKWQKFPFSAADISQQKISELHLQQ